MIKQQQTWQTSKLSGETNSYLPFMLRFLFVLLLSISLMSVVLALGDDDDGNCCKQPDQIGRYNVGSVTLNDVAVFTGTVNVTIWYPTNERSLKRSEYDTSQFGASFSLPSPNNAIMGAEPAKGKFPLIIHNHGGGSAIDIGRIFNYNRHEHMASHGFVVIGYNRVPGITNTAENTRALIDEMANFSKTAPTVLDKIKKVTNTKRVGVTGTSAGAPGTMGIVAGTSDGGTPDSRIKGMVLYEPSTGGSSLQSEIQIPYLVVEGSPGFEYENFFENVTTKAFPRYRVIFNNNMHIGLTSTLCDVIEVNRNTTLANTFGLPVDPLVDGSIDANAFVAFFYWNLSEFFGIGIGNARESCNKVGVVNPNGPFQNTFYDLDLDDDGFTDTPPFNTALDGVTPSILPERLTADEILRLQHIYEISFYKVYVAGDKSFKRFLNQEYADDNGLDVEIDVIGK